VRVAVYGISKNEAASVAAWAESCAEADYRILLDTGSSDATVELARQAGVTVFEELISPWRFDDARNRSLELIPADVDLCISLDLDEVLVSGWREELKKSFDPHVTRYRYPYTWSWNDDGQPGLQYAGDKIHTRHGYTWRYPVHEVLIPIGEEVQGRTSLQIFHFRDQGKDRGQYLPLLELAVAEDPDNDRNAHYLAREYMYEGRFEEAAREFNRHLALPTALWDAERAQSLRFLAVCEPEKAEHWLPLAVKEAPSRREPWVDLAFHYFVLERWDECLEACQKALVLDRRPEEYLTESQAWGSRLDDMAANASFHLHDFAGAVRHGERAVELEPADHRLHVNLAKFREALDTWAPALDRTGDVTHWRVLPAIEMLTVAPPADLPSGWVLMNPSIASDGEHMRMTVRTVNYHLVHDHYDMVDSDGVIRSRTGIVDVSSEGDFTNWQWIDDSSATTPSPLFPVHGVEDMRLFPRGSGWWTLGAIRDHSKSGAIRQVLSELIERDNGVALDRPWRIPSPLTADDGEAVYEKNWVVIPSDGFGLDAVWSTQPFARLWLDLLARQVVPSVGRPTRLAEHEWRGSSPVFATPHGPVYVAHRVGPSLSSPNRPARTYLHCFVTYCGEHVHMGPPFAIEELSLEFVAGGCYSNTHVYLSFGRDDSSARLAICCWAEVSPLIHPACPSER
jgi:tetratricopeptide (TPR) repeat protein